MSSVAVKTVRGEPAGFSPAAVRAASILPIDALMAVNPSSHLALPERIAAGRDAISTDSVLAPLDGMPGAPDSPPFEGAGAAIGGAGAGVEGAPGVVGTGAFGAGVLGAGEVAGVFGAGWLGWSCALAKPARQTRHTAKAKLAIGPDFMKSLPHAQTPASAAPARRKHRRILAAHATFSYMKLEVRTQDEHMHPLASRSVIKMNGLGNEIVILDLRDSAFALTPELVVAIGRGEGLAFDQLMALEAPQRPGTAAFVRIFNADGSESGACGNGARCVAWSLMRGTNAHEIQIETRAGLIACRRESEWRFAVDMGRPLFGWADIPLARPIEDTQAIPLDLGGVPASAAAVNMGNPHAIFIVADLKAYDLGAIGPGLERDPLFPERANISLAEIIDRGHIRLRVWERGAGLTRACGSAACAALVAAANRNLTEREAQVSLPGGELEVSWRPDDHVTLSGPVEYEFERALDPLLFEGEAA